MNIIEKVNKSRYTLKELLKEEWSTESIADLSYSEMEKIYAVPSAKNKSLSVFGVAAGCNFSLEHKFIPTHKLHIIYYNFPEVGRVSSKITKSACDKIMNLYKDESIDFEDSLLIIINDKISESLEKSFLELNVTLQNDYEDKNIVDKIVDEMKDNDYPLQKKHLRNVHIFNIDSLTNNLLKHRLVPEHQVIRDHTSIQQILTNCNCNGNQLPIILKTDMVSKLKRLATGDICIIIREGSKTESSVKTKIKSGEYPFYRICK
jgi:DNA-directed RNA polymerase subunit H (RpoH/RPB5)